MKDYTGTKICFAHFVNINYGMHCHDADKKNSPYGDFANDMLCDKDFPWLHSLKPENVIEYHDVVLAHLNANGACKEAIATFEELFGMYITSDYIEQWRFRRAKNMARRMKDDNIAHREDKQ